ncbi:MAG TPA: AAA family ATPase, partial [Jiangellaceae bacterium]|nr:AAA family ATPase [Jiangellaceae bacterium]
ILRQADEPPPRTPEAPADPKPPPPGTSRLPRLFSSFVGRDGDLDRVVDLLAGARLVTLTGPGGVGKTRLATEAAVRALESGLAPDGGWLVDLSALNDPALLDEAVAQALDLRSGSGPIAAPAANVRDQVVAALSGKRALLLLDNCEHLVAAAAGFARDLLARTGLVTMLSTSREALGMPGETVWSVPSLALPPEGAAPVPEDLRRWGATQLFVDRAKAADPDFVLDPATAPLVMEVSRRLDGIPLALELAAASVRTLGLSELAARLDDRFAVLTAGDRTAQPRQQTLRAVIEWSWDLLDDSERTLFRRLSVFGGGATLAAIEAVCSDPDHVPAGQVVTLAAALTDKSMITVDRRDRPARHRMLETLRAFATGRLADSGEEAELRRRHADHLLAVATAEVPKLRTADQLDAMRRLDGERDNVRAALRWLDEAGDDVRGARLAVELGWYWYLRGLRTEGLHWLSAFSAGAEPRERALARLWSVFLAPDRTGGPPVPQRIEDAATTLAEHGSPADRTFASLVASVLYVSLGDGSAAARHRATSRALIEETGDEQDAAIADFVEGQARLIVGDLAAGLPWLEAALDRFTSLGDRWGQVQCLVALLSCAEMTGDLVAALGHADRGIERAGELRLREMEAILHCRRATVATLAGDHDAAAHSLDRAGQLADELGTEVVAGNVSLAAGFLAMRSGHLDNAERHFERVLDWIGGSPYPALRSYALARLGTVAELKGDHNRAIRLLRGSYADASTVGDPRAVAFALEGLAAAFATSGRPLDAAMLLGAAEARRASVGLPLPAAERADVDRAEAAARTHLGDAAFEEAADRGRSSGPEQLPLT